MSGVLVRATAWMFCCKKRFSHGVLADTDRSFRFFSSEALPFLAAKLMVTLISVSR